MKRILVLNDSQELLELFRSLLTEEGYDVIMCSAALADLREIEQIRPELIILDIMLGNRETRGWQMLERLSLSSATTSVPIVLCTAAVDIVRERESDLASHGIIVILKPFNIEHLLECIEKALCLRAD